MSPRPNDTTLKPRHTPRGFLFGALRREPRPSDLATRFVYTPARVHLSLRWGHSLRKSVCFSMRRGGAYWGHLGKKLRVINERLNPF
jgi:hypothetical protein